MTSKRKKPIKGKTGVGLYLGLIALVVAGVSATSLVLSYSGGNPQTVVEKVENFYAASNPAPEVAESQGNQFEFVGTAGDTFSSKKTAQILMSTTPTTTACTLLNGSGQDRVVTDVSFYQEGSSGSYQTATRLLEFGTSTSQYTTSTKPIWSISYATTTAGNAVQYATSTFNGTASAESWKLKWKNGEYLNGGLNFTVSTTDGFCAVDYYLD